MQDFEYVAPRSLAEAAELLGHWGSRARVLAGGTDLLVQLREGHRTAGMLVDVKRIDQMRFLEFHSGRPLRMGAATSCYQLYQHPELPRNFAALDDAARIVGGWQIQCRASFGGNLCNASPAADSIPAMIVHDGVAQIVGRNGTRSLPISQFCTAPGRNALAEGELLAGLEFPWPRPRSGSAYLRFIPRNEMDIAVVGVGAAVELDDSQSTVVAARIALGAVAPTPLVAEQAAASLVGQPADTAAFQRAGEMARTIARPISDQRGPADYRRHLVGVLVARALALAADRAKAAQPQPRS